MKEVIVGLVVFIVLLAVSFVVIGDEKLKGAPWLSCYFPEWIKISTAIVIVVGLPLLAIFLGDFRK